eukprot:268719-Rhodomonas_salina.2
MPALPEAAGCQETLRPASQTLHPLPSVHKHAHALTLWSATVGLYFPSVFAQRPPAPTLLRALFFPAALEKRRQLLLQLGLLQPTLSQALLQAVD